jgi:bisphosphoglycerate-independent phosphoglycerate mutase (AlkP superfamily)
MDGGKPMREYLNLVQNFVNEEHAEDFKNDFIVPLKKSIEHLQTALMFFMENGLKNPLSAVSGATDFLHLVGLVSLGFIWSKKAQSAKEQLKNSRNNKKFLEAKILTGSYFMHRQLPETKLRLDRVLTGEKQVMSLAANQF